MWTRRTYYFLKPCLPWSLRLAVRRWRAKRQKIKFANTWPISPAAGQPPKGWRGWPGGKQFALVLTHDVESRKGLDRCRRLMELEASMGFRSSFNFVPEGSYSTPKELRDHLTGNGFEVGVHDLRHDGKLYRTKKDFRENARRINRYLKDWKAVGFRSAFMLHRLDWLHDLDVLYDASTFDTDPFEPQPDGMDTIFPFYLEGDNGRPGYVELPYTLVQDFTLFVLLGESSIDVWKRKAAWVAQSGGMVLLNTHPDYMTFADEERQRDEFDVSLYEQFLLHIRETHKGAYWPALPREVARFWKSAAAAGATARQENQLSETPGITTI
jgi:hypothetical protein